MSRPVEWEERDPTPRAVISSIHAARWWLEIGTAWPAVCRDIWSRATRRTEADDSFYIGRPGCGHRARW